jgi:hypothetical protein
MTTAEMDLNADIEDPQERAVLLALANENWDFRTVGGIARETGLDSEVVRETLVRRSDLVRRSPVPSADGEDLYTLRDRDGREGGLREALSFLRGAISKTPSS